MFSFLPSLRFLHHLTPVCLNSKIRVLVICYLWGETSSLFGAKDKYGMQKTLRY